MIHACRAGTGTFGRVRLVRCRATGRYLALKALKKAQILSLRQERSVHKEKQILASLQHPFIVRMCAPRSAPDQRTCW